MQTIFVGLFWSQSIDETVLHESRGENRVTMPHFTCENKNIMPDTFILDDDELEALVNIYFIIYYLFGFTYLFSSFSQVCSVLVRCT